MKSTVLHKQIHWGSFSNIMSLCRIWPEDIIHITGNIFSCQATGENLWCPKTSLDEIPQLHYQRPVPFLSIKLTWCRAVGRRPSTTTHWIQEGAVKWKQNLHEALVFGEPFSKSSHCPKLWHIQDILLADPAAIMSCRPPRNIRRCSVLYGPRFAWRWRTPQLLMAAQRVTMQHGDIHNGKLTNHVPASSPPFRNFETLSININKK